LLELGAMPRRLFHLESAELCGALGRGAAGMAGMALAEAFFFAYFASRTFATRFLHILLRGVTAIGLTSSAKSISTMF